jgi:hypothetical protein
VERDPERIDPIIENLRALWKKYPQQRLTQLIVNYLGDLGQVPGFYHQEDHITALKIKREKERL